MSQQHDGRYELSGHTDEDNLERLLLEGVTLQEKTLPPTTTNAPHTHNNDSDNDPDDSDDPDEEVDNDVHFGSDLQGALGLFAEASQDMATATLELSLGRHFACVDFCNQAVEKAAQSISLLRFGRRSRYDHDLRALGILVGAPPAIQDEMARLTPFHPEAFYADTPPEEADEVISAEQASDYIKSARTVLRWAKSLVLSA